MKFDKNIKLGWQGCLSYGAALAFGFKKVIYKNGEIIYSKKDFNFINTNKAR